MSIRKKSKHFLLHLSQICGGDPSSCAGIPVHRQARRGVPSQLAAWLQDHQARHQSCPGILHRRQLNTTQHHVGAAER